MSVYAVQGTQTASAKTALVVVSTVAIRPRIIEYKSSTTGAPSSDAGYEIQVKRFTAAGTTTALTPASTDSGDPAATLTAGSNATVEPTYTASTTIDDYGANPRATFRWVAYDQRAEIILPATAANGVGWLLNALGGASTVIIDAKVLQ
jgi:hypothetical protein